MSNTVTIDVVAEVRKATAAIGDVTTSLGKVEKAARSSAPMLKGALAADVITAGFTAMISAGKSAADTVSLQADLAAQTQAALTSTGGAANVTAGDITALSEAIEGKSKIDAEAITSGQNLLLTFTEVQNRAGAGNDIFAQSTQIMADMSTALGQDTSAAAMQLGKALNDPVKGMSALSEVGVTFTADQKKAAEAMMATGDTAGAQKIILAELGKEFGGSAAASAATFSGTMFQLKNTLGGVLEDGFRALQPALMDAATWLQEKLPPAIDSAKAAFARIKAALEPVVSAIGALIGWMKDNPETVTAFGVTLGILAGIIGAVAAAQAIWNAAMALNPIGLIVLAIAGLVAAGVYLVTHWDQISAKISAVWDRIKSAIGSALRATGSAITGWIRSVVSWFGGLPAKAGAALSRFGSTLAAKASAAMSALRGGLSDKWGTVADYVRGIPGRVTSAIGDLAGLLKSHGRAILSGLLAGLREKWGDVTSFVGGIATWIADHKGPLSYDRVLLKPAGAAILGGLVDSLRAQMPTLARQMGEITAMIAQVSTTVAGPTITAPTFAGLGSAAALAGAGTADLAPINVYITVGPTADRVAVGREVTRALTEYRTRGGRR